MGNQEFADSHVRDRSRRGPLDRDTRPCLVGGLSCDTASGSSKECASDLRVLGRSLRSKLVKAFRKYSRCDGDIHVVAGVQVLRLELNVPCVSALGLQDVAQLRVGLDERLEDGGILGET